MKSIATLRNSLLVLALFVAVLFPVYSRAAEDSATASATSTAKETTDQAKAAMGDLSKKINENRLVNRTPAEIAAWVIMGVLVGALAGFFSPFQATFLGRFLILAFGLAGAFLGGMVARVGKLDFGWTDIQISSEELVCSFGGAFAIVLIGRVIRWKLNKARGGSDKHKKQ